MSNLPAELDYVEKVHQDYLDAIVAYVNLRPHNEELLRQVEEKAEIPEQMADDFRRNLMCQIATNLYQSGALRFSTFPHPKATKEAIEAVAKEKLGVTELTMEVNCRECGRPYHKKIFDLDLKVGDRVIYESWVGGECEKFPITITDTTYKSQGLYFGWQNNVVWPDQVNDNVRVDTRNNEFVKVE